MAGRSWQHGHSDLLAHRGPRQPGEGYHQQGKGLVAARRVRALRLPDKPLEDGLGYTGHESDARTGLVYMQQRYYDPELGGLLPGSQIPG